MINQLLLRKYGGQTGVLLAAMLGAADCGHRYSLKKLSRLTGLSERQVTAHFQQIRKMGFVIRRWFIGEHTSEYWIERPQSTNKTKP